MKYLNVVGPQIRKLRSERNWTQIKLAAKLQIAGWDKDRCGVAKIEAGLVNLVDWEFIFLAEVFQVGLYDLFPKNVHAKPARETVARLREKKKPNPDLHIAKFDASKLKAAGKPLSFGLLASGVQLRRGESHVCAKATLNERLRLAPAHALSRSNGKKRN